MNSGSTHAEHYFQRKGFNGYVKEHYEMSGFMSGTVSLDPSPVSRLHHNLLNAIKDHHTLPKMIIVVPDNNILQFIVQKNNMSSIHNGQGNSLDYVRVHEVDSSSERIFAC